MPLPPPPDTQPLPLLLPMDTQHCTPRTKGQSRGIVTGQPSPTSPWEVLNTSTRPAPTCWVTTPSERLSKHSRCFKVGHITRVQGMGAKLTPIYMLAVPPPAHRTTNSIPILTTWWNHHTGAREPDPPHLSPMDLSKSSLRMSRRPTLLDQRKQHPWVSWD